MTSGRAGDQARDFDPGNSFTEDSLTAPNPSELPSWLQNFAEMTADAPPSPPAPASAPAPAPAPALSQPQGQANDSMMPGWLDATNAAAQSPTPSALTDASPIGGADFFSEDDLPEWLRALSNPPSADNPASMNSATSTAPMAMPVADRHEPQASSASSHAVTATLAVPIFARIWITAHDMPEQSAGASVFAEVAQVADLQPDVLVSETPSGIGSQAVRETSAPVTAVEKTPRTGNSWSWTFRLAVLMIIILVVVGLVYMNLAG